MKAKIPHIAMNLGTSKMITVATVCAGDKYTPDYVTKLYNAVERHLTVPYKFVCLTDKPDSFECETLPIPLNLSGWWGKVALFSNIIENRILFFDLDTVITRNINDFATYDGDLAIIKPFYRDDGYASGVMNIGPGAHKHVWDIFSSNPQGAINECERQAIPPWNIGDQRWLELTVPRADYWQSLLPNQLVSYRVHCMANKSLPKNACIVCFHGKPDPHEVNDEWIVSNWK